MKTHRVSIAAAFKTIVATAVVAASVSVFLAGVARFAGHAQVATGVRFEVSFPAAVSAAPLDGRLLLLLSTDSSQEPRFQINDQPQTQQIFGTDVEGLAPSAPARIDASAIGYPLESLAQVHAGDYYVQALFNRYTTFHRSDRHTVKLPKDEGEGQQWNIKPGNLYSAPQHVHIDPSAAATIPISVDHKIAPLLAPADTPYVKHLAIESRLLSQFWGTPTSLGAIVVLPEGFERQATAHYPLVIWHDHFRAEFTLRTTPPVASLKDDERVAWQRAFDFYRWWSAPQTPRVLLVLLQHANPFYDDSYAVNSANVGPYGDAITQELLPEIERRYRGLGQPWARAMFGGSTGGWETLADQVFYPEYFNGAWCACPDPVDFRAYQIVDIYKDANAYWLEGPWSRVPRPEERTTIGSVTQTMERANRREFVLGTHTRSGDQFAIWQAVFSPVGRDGYPADIWDPRSGVIHREVAAYWRDHYDLRYILQRDWAALGPKLAGKLHFAVGDMDTYYLNNAVHLLEEFFQSTEHPRYVPDFEYGARQPHCYFGDPKVPAHQRVLPQMAAHFVESAPPGADVSSWRY